jgi:hypothetical protein
MKKKEELLKDLDQSTTDFIEQIKKTKPISRRDSEKGKGLKNLFK